MREERPVKPTTSPWQLLKDLTKSIETGGLMMNRRLIFNTPTSCKGKLLADVADLKVRLAEIEELLNSTEG